MEQGKRTVLITGGTRGIGRACVDKFAANGFNVAFCYKKSDHLANEINTALLEKGVNSLALKCDVTSSLQVQQLYNVIKVYFGNVDVLINNAGVSHFGLMTDDTDKDFDEVIAQNLKSVFLMCRMFAPDMVSEKRGAIINISSIHGINGASCEALYSAAKSGVIGFTKSLANELAPSNVTVNAICPGLIDTDMNKYMVKEDLKAFVDGIPLQRIGKPSEVASAALYLANALYVTGEVIKVAGGL